MLCMHAYVCVQQDSKRLGELDIRMVEGMVFIYARLKVDLVSNFLYRKSRCRGSRGMLFKMKHSDRLQAQGVLREIWLGQRETNKKTFTIRTEYWNR